MELLTGTLGVALRNLSQFISAYATQVGTLDQRFQCRICDGLLRFPVIQTGCGSHMCKQCFDETVARIPGKCPVDKEPSCLEQVFQDKLVERQLSAVLVSCCNKGIGCTWQGEYLTYLRDHENECEYALKACPNDGCMERVQRRSLEIHAEKECTFRPDRCAYCREQFSFLQAQVHQFVCDKRPVSLPAEQAITTLGFKNLSEHMAACNALSAEGTCVYSAFGCRFKGKSQADVREHLHKEVEMHAKLSVAELFLLRAKNELNMRALNELRDFAISLSRKLEPEAKRTQDVVLDLQRLQSEYETLKLELSSEKLYMDARIQKVHLVAENLKDRLARWELNSPSANREDSTLTADLVAESVAKLKELADRISVVENSLALVSANVADSVLNLTLLEHASYNGVIIWKVDNILNRIASAETGNLTALHSPPCYTHRFGYKFCMRLYLNGDGSGKASHVSLFFVVMKGEYDALLDWPFRHRVRFRLVSPDSSKSSISETFLPSQNSSSFQRPKNSMNVAAGCPLFVLKDRIKRQEFVVDDSIFLQCIVEMSG